MKRYQENCAGAESLCRSDALSRAEKQIRALVDPGRCEDMRQWKSPRRTARNTNPVQRETVTAVRSRDRSVGFPEWIAMRRPETGCHADGWSRRQIEWVSAMLQQTAKTRHPDSLADPCEDSLCLKQDRYTAFRNGLFACVHRHCLPAQPYERSPRSTHSLRSGPPPANPFDEINERIQIVFYQLGLVEQFRASSSHSQSGLLRFDSATLKGFRNTRTISDPETDGRPNRQRVWRKCP